MITTSAQYYWWLAHTGLPCQHCGHQLEPVTILAFWSSGKVRCPECREHLPQFDPRDYGVKQRRVDSVLGNSFVDYVDNHWTTTFHNRPLWAI